MTFSLLSAELLKIRKRWLVYVLLLVMLVGATVHVWLGGYASYKSSSGHDFESINFSLHTFVLPYALPALLDSGQFWGSLLIGILTASVVATEYNWGTVRQALLRGQTRSQYLLVKLAGISAIGVVLLALALAFGLLLAVIATATAGKPITFDAPGGPNALEAIVMVLRSGYCILPYGLLAFLLAVVGRSTTMGVAGIVLYLFMESILVAILSGLGGPAPTIRSFILGYNVSALLSANVIDGALYNSMAFRDNPEAAQLPGAWMGALAVAVYCAAFVTVTFAVFQKRDLTSGAGAS